MACHQPITGYLAIEYTYHTTDNYEGERPMRPDTAARQNDLGDQAVAIRDPTLSGRLFASSMLFIKLFRTDISGQRIGHIMDTQSF